jgi:hypothetical protein
MSKSSALALRANESPGREKEIRIIVHITGRYSLANRRETTGNRREFACRAINMSPFTMALTVPVYGDIGDRVITYFDEFGELEGRIVSLLTSGFVMTIAATPEERARLTAKLAWLDKHKNHDVHDHRTHRRIVPRNPHSTLVLGDGSRLGCFVIDMSASGAAVSADVDLEIGAPLAVGKVVGRVVRRFAEGFAVEFIDRQDPDRLEHMVIRH